MNTKSKSKSLWTEVETQTPESAPAIAKTNIHVCGQLTVAVILHSIKCRCGAEVVAHRHHESNRWIIASHCRPDGRWCRLSGRSEAMLMAPTARIDELQSPGPGSTNTTNTTNTTNRRVA